MGFLPSGVHHQQIAGLEVLLADGEIVRTGQFAINGSGSAHASKHSFGPSVEGLFIQSNLGIVTKMGIWLSPQPQAYLSCTLDMPEMQDIATIVDVLGPLRRNGVIDSTLWTASATETFAVFHKGKELWDEDSAIPEWRLKELMRKFDIGFWTTHFGLYGPEAVIKAHFQEIEKVVEAKAPTGILRSNLYSGKSAEMMVSDVLVKGDMDMFIGKPGFQSMEIMKFNLPLDDSGCVTAHQDFAPIMPAIGKTVLDWTEVSREICEAEGFDLFCDFFLQERSVIFVYLTPYDKANPQHRKATKPLPLNFKKKHAREDLQLIEATYLIWVSPEDHRHRRPELIIMKRL
jgi:hypothetical protein